MKRQQVKKIVNYALLVVTILTIISGLGISQPYIVTPATFGILDKLTAFRLHLLLWGPFTILFTIHVALNTLPKRWF